MVRRNGEGYILYNLKSIYGICFVTNPTGFYPTSLGFYADIVPLFTTSALCLISKGYLLS